MSYNYLKKYKLTFENVVESQDEYLTELKQQSSIFLPDADLTRVTTYGTSFDDLHMEANISFNPTTTSSNNNSSEIKVFNLSKDVRDRISQVNGRVILEAGYEEGDFDVIFTGQINDIYTNKNGADLVTVISCKDGWTPTNHIRYTKSFGKGTSFQDIFEDMITVFEQHGISRSDTGILLNEPNPPWAVPADTKVSKSWSYSGFLRGGMDKLCTEFGLTYQIEHSTLFIYPKNYQKMFTELELTEEQIISIRRASNSQNKTPNEVSNNAGIQVQTLLLPKVTPKYRVKVVAKEQSDEDSYNLKPFVGEYKITALSHRLSYEGDGWTTTMTCEAIE